MKRRDFFMVAGTAAVWPFAAWAQQSQKIARIGFLGPGPANSDLLVRCVAALRAGLGDLGYVEGKSIAIEFRWAESNYYALPDLAAELVHLNVDVLVAYALPGVLAAMQATTTIPIFMAVSAEPIRLSLITSLNRPGGNATGNTFFNPELNAKLFEFLKEVLPRSSRIAVLLNPFPWRAPVYVDSAGAETAALIARTGTPCSCPQIGTPTHSMATSESAGMEMSAEKIGKTVVKPLLSQASRLRWL